MPIENAMRKPADFLRIPGVLTNTMVVIGSLFLLVGSVGYVKFGDDVAGSITLNLARDWWVDSFLYYYYGWGPLRTSSDLDTLWFFQRTLRTRTTISFHHVESVQIADIII